MASIRIQTNGPYEVEGLPLVRKQIVYSEYGEPQTWLKEEGPDRGEDYWLCRCGRSADKPFCDGSHQRVGFDGTETATNADYETEARRYEGTRITVRDDRSLCLHAGFCGDRISNVWDMVEDTGDTQIRAKVMAMIERCPSGALSYEIEPGHVVVEPDLPAEVALVPNGPLWVTGRIRVERSDGSTLEARNRIALCRCGKSSNKPLCDGTHLEVGFEAP